MWPIVGGIAAAIIVWFVLFWALVTEGSYLGGPWVRWSYDALARWYEGKWNSPEYQADDVTRRLFLDPVLAVTASNPESKVLDLACGTGRGSRLLLADSRFRGTIVAIDFSKGMLARFCQALNAWPADQRNRVAIEHRDLTQWNCPQPESCDAVLFLEAAELIPDNGHVVREAARALKPGGVLITTRVTDRFLWLFRSRRQSKPELESRLRECGFSNVVIESWRPRYDVVRASRSGWSETTHSRDDVARAQFVNAVSHR